VNAPQDHQVAQHWASFLRLKDAVPGPPPRRYQAWSFGNTAEMADQLGELVRTGVKTAAASLLWTLEAENEPYPAVGEYSIILDGRGKPMCIILTTDVRVIPFDEVTADHAYMEGEGDRSLAYWREVHWGFFGQECRQARREPTAKMPVLCERFKLVHK